jgi:hypothetical protein
MTAAVAVADLTDVEAGALVECERVIERGLRTFVEVGQALARIRDERLYRSEYASFEAYCADRFQLSRPRAYQLMSAAGVVSGIPDTMPKPTNAQQALELAKVPEEQRADVWREARYRTYGRPTAETIREVVKERQAPPAPSTPDLDVMLRYSPVAGWIVGSPGGAPWATAGVDIPELDVKAAQLWAADETLTEHGRDVIRWAESTDRAGAWIAVLADDGAPITQTSARPDLAAPSVPGAPAVATTSGPDRTAAGGSSDSAPADGAASAAGLGPASAVVPAVADSAPASAPAAGEPAGAEVTPETAAVVSGTRPADAAASATQDGEAAAAVVPAGAGAAAAGAPTDHPSAGAPVTPSAVCESCGADLAADEVEAAYVRCGDCDPDGEHFLRDGRCAGCAAVDVCLTQREADLITSAAADALDGYADNDRAVILSALKKIGDALIGARKRDMAKAGA